MGILYCELLLRLLYGYPVHQQNIAYTLFLKRLEDNEKSRTICINFFSSLPPTSIHISCKHTNTLISRFERFYNSAVVVAVPIHIYSLFSYIRIYSLIFSAFVLLFSLLFTFICVSNATWNLSWAIVVMRARYYIFISTSAYSKSISQFQCKQIGSSINESEAFFSKCVRRLSCSGYILVLSSSTWFPRMIFNLYLNFFPK